MKVGKMAQGVQALGTKSDNLSFIPKTHRVEENQLCKLSSELHTCALICTYVYVYTHTKCHLKTIK